MADHIAKGCFIEGPFWRKDLKPLKREEAIEAAKMLQEFLETIGYESEFKYRDCTMSLTDKGPGEPHVGFQDLKGN